MLGFLKDNFQMFEFDWTEAFRSVGRSPFLSAEKYDLKKGCQSLHANPLKA